MKEIFGSFIEDFSDEQDSLELIFTPSSHRIKQLWRSRRLSAHFVADYFVNFLPVNQKYPIEGEQWIKETKAAVSYIANELLENAMKYNLKTSKYKIKFGINFLETSELTAVIFVTNSVDNEGAENFKDFIQKLLASDPEEFYIQQVESSAKEENDDISRLGFVTAINDYQVKLGWKFESFSSQPEVITVTTMAQLPV